MQCLVCSRRPCRSCWWVQKAGDPNGAFRAAGELALLRGGAFYDDCGNAAALLYVGIILVASNRMQLLQIEAELKTRPSDSFTKVSIAFVVVEISIIIHFSKCSCRLRDT